MSRPASKRFLKALEKDRERRAEIERAVNLAVVEYRDALRQVREAFGSSAAWEEGSDQEAALLAAERLTS